MPIEVTLYLKELSALYSLEQDSKNNEIVAEIKGYIPQNGSITNGNMIPNPIVDYEHSGPSDDVEINDETVVPYSSVTDRNEIVSADTTTSSSGIDDEQQQQDTDGHTLLLHTSIASAMKKRPKETYEAILAEPTRPWGIHQRRPQNHLYQ